MPPLPGVNGLFVLFEYALACGYPILSAHIYELRHNSSLICMLHFTKRICDLHHILSVFFCVRYTYNRLDFLKIS